MRRRSHVHRWALGSAGVLALLLTPERAAAQQNDWQGQVRLMLSTATDRLKARGFAESHDPVTESLRDDSSKDMTVRLQAGGQYAIVGVCDVDCKDMDFRLYDENDQEVAKDVEMDDVPIVEVQPLRTATFRLRVTMADCESNPCWWGVGVYRKQDGAAEPTIREKAPPALVRAVLPTALPGER